MSKPKIKKFVAFSCPHFPYADDNAIDFLFAQIQDHKPDVIVHMGDGHDATAASRWGDEGGVSLLEECRMHEEFLFRLVDSSPESEFVFMEGNHDNNIRAEGRISKGVREMCDYRSYEPSLKEFKFFPYEYRRENTYKLGQVTFAHGFEHGINSNRNQAVRLGVPYGLFINGHTHRPQDVEQAYAGGLYIPYWSANAGTLRDMNVGYMERKSREHWGQAVVIGEAADIKSPRLSCNWDAETKVHKWFDSTNKKV